MRAPAQFRSTVCDSLVAACTPLLSSPTPQAYIALYPGIALLQPGLFNFWPGRAGGGWGGWRVAGRALAAQRVQGLRRERARVGCAHVRTYWYCYAATAVANLASLPHAGGLGLGCATCHVCLADASSPPIPPPPLAADTNAWYHAAKTYKPGTVTDVGTGGDQGAGTWWAGVQPAALQSVARMTQVAHLCFWALPHHNWGKRLEAARRSFSCTSRVRTAHTRHNTALQSSYPMPCSLTWLPTPNAVYP